jgi:hypothetical protein
MGVIKIKGAAKVAKLYNVTRLEMEGVDFSEYDLESAEDVRELFETVNDFVESGEADAIEPPLEIQGVDPDESAIQIGEKSYFSDELTLKNIKLEELLEPIQDAEVGDIYYIRTLEGDGQWLIESEDEVTPEDVEIGYVDCSLYFDQYDVLREGYLEVICDTVLPDRLSVKDQRVEVAEFIFDPVQIFAQLYRVVETDGVKVLERIDYGGRVLAGTDFIVDDFEAN